MNFISKIFKRSDSNLDTSPNKVGGTEDFMTLIRVYYQSVMAHNFGIRDLRILPDLRVFKQTLKVQTLNNRIGLGEKKRCKKILQDIYHLSDNFFVEIDSSIKRRCRNINDMQGYLYQFQGFSQELMMLMSNLINWKFRLPSFLKATLRHLIKKAVTDIFTKTSWKDEGVRKAASNIKNYQKQLGYSQEWMVEFVYNIIILAKKEPKKEALTGK